MSTSMSSCDLATKTSNPVVIMPTPERNETNKVESDDIARRKGLDIVWLEYADAETDRSRGV